MSKLVSYDVTEHFDRNAPRSLGRYLHPTSAPPIRAGDSILARWPDEDATRHVRVDLVRGGVVHVTAIAPCDGDHGMPACDSVQCWHGADWLA